MNRLLKNIFPVLIFSFCMITPAQAQSGSEDVIYLKNGGILRGEIVEYTNTETVRIRTAGHNVFVVRMNEIRKITQEDKVESIFFKTSGYMNRTGLELLPETDSMPLHVQTVHGYHFNARFSAGLGIGFILYNKEHLNLVPLFADVQYRMLTANTTPFLHLRAGHSFSIESDNDIGIDDHSGGFLLAPGIGLQVHTSAGFGWYLSAGYHLDNSSYDRRLNGRIYTSDISHRRLRFGFGLTF